MNKPSLFIKNPEKLGVILLCFGHALAAYFSFGFHHPDEHFQILEFANYWVGVTKDPSFLPWEYTAQIRPWFQPLIHGIVMKLAIAIHAYNAFTLAFLFRAFYALLNIFSMLYLWRVLKEKFCLNPLWFLWIGALWFLPYIHVRTSSENLSGIFLTFAFALLLKGKRYFWPGVLFGFAFLARYQIALGVFGLGVFLLIRDRKITKDHLVLLFGFLIPVTFGILLDRIGYGDWAFTAYRYFKVNLVDGVAATYNPYPWYQYFIWILQLNPLVSLPLFFGVFFYTKKVKMDELSFFVLSFFVLHLFITNKEYRFLFPILNLVPFMMAIGFQKYEKWFLSKKSFLVYGVVSMISFSVSSLHGASVQTLWCVHAAHEYSTPGETWLTNHDYLDQFSRGYYQLSDHHILVYHNGQELETELQKHPAYKVMVDGSLQDEVTKEILAVVERHHCSILTSARPKFLFALRGKLSMIDRLTFKAVFQCP